MSEDITREIESSTVSIRHSKNGVIIRPAADLDAKHAREVAYAILKTFIGSVKCVYWDMRGLGMSAADKSVHKHLGLSTECFGKKIDMAVIIGQSESSFHARVLRSIMESHGRDCRIIRAKDKSQGVTRKRAASRLAPA